MLTVAVQYPSFGPQHPPRLDAIVEAADGRVARVVAMEMFGTDSDYAWRPVATDDTPWTRYTMMRGSSEEGRRNRRLKEIVYGALDEIDADVVVVNGWGHRESRHSLSWCRQRDRRIVLLSDSVRENRRRYPWKEAAKKLLVRGADAGFVAGTPQSRYLTWLGISPSKIFQPGSCVVDNAYWGRVAEEARKSPDVRERYGLPDRYFLTVSRFLWWKNTAFLVDAYAKYVASVGDDAVGLVICGSGPEEARIRGRIQYHGLKTVHLAGFRQVDDLPYYYAFADCFVLASCWFECWGLVVNEAMASGLPVVVSNEVGCTEDLVHNGVNGYLFDPKDVDELSVCLRNVAESSDRRDQMKAASQRIVAGHSTTVGADNFWRAVNCAIR